MPSGPGFLQSGESVGETSGPNASLEFGQASKMVALNAQLKNSQPQAYAQGKPPDRTGGQPGMAGTAPGQPQPGGAQPSPPVQPPPRQPLTPQEVDQQVFSPAQQPQLHWREGLRQLAADPQAGPYLRALARLAEQGFGAPSSAPTPPR